MNIFSTYTLKSLKENKVRTIVTIMGVIVSVAMICAITTLIASLNNYTRQETMSSKGNWHINIENLTYSEVLEYKNNEDLYNVNTNQIQGFAKFDKPGEINMPYLYLLGTNKSFLDNIGLKVVKGRLPEKENEILLPRGLMTYVGKEIYKLDDRIKLTLGDRISLEDFTHNDTVYKRGDAIPQGVRYKQDTEQFEETQMKEYIVVGFYECFALMYFDSAGDAALTLEDTQNIEEYGYNIYFKEKSLGGIYAKYDKLHQVVYQNNSLIAREQNGFMAFSKSMGITIIPIFIVILIIIFASIALIYNAFAISVNERTKQYGLLSSIGATKRQLKKTVLYEAMYVSVVGIPLGILSGILGIGTTLFYVGPKITESILNSEVGFTMSVSYVSIIVACILSFVTVLISAYIPSRRATKVTAMEAIKLSKDIKIKHKKVKSGNLVMKLFGIEGLLADKYFKRSKKKYRATVISLSMSIILFIVVSSFCGHMRAQYIYENENTINSSDLSYAYYSISNADDINNIYEQFKKFDNVNDMNYIVELNYHDISIAKRYINYESGIRVYGDGLSALDEYIVYSNIVFVDDKTYTNLLKENYIPAESNLNKILFYENSNEYNKSGFSSNIKNDFKFKMFNLSAFDIDSRLNVNYRGENLVIYYDDNGNHVKKEIVLNNEEAEDITDEFKVDYVIENVSSLMYFSPYPLFILPLSECENYSGVFSNDANAYVQLKTSNHKQLIEDFKKITSNLNYGYSFINNVQSKINVQNTIVVINVFSYGFITLITFIAIANVFNTITTNIYLRKRDFAMLQSVGMSEKGIQKMTRYECIMYGLKSLLYGIPPAIILATLAYMVMFHNYFGEYVFPWKSILISCVFVFLIVFATMSYAVKKLRQINIIETLKNENI